MEVWEAVSPLGASHTCYSKITEHRAAVVSAIVRLRNEHSILAILLSPLFALTLTSLYFNAFHLAGESSKVGTMLFWYVHQVHSCWALSHFIFKQLWKKIGTTSCDHHQQSIRKSPLTSSCEYCLCNSTLSMPIFWLPSPRLYPVE